VDWSKLQPGDPVDEASHRGKSTGIISPDDAPEGTIICLKDERYYYDPNREMKGVHFSRATDSQGTHWKEVK
jgi:hypothetical protein